MIGQKSGNHLADVPEDLDSRGLDVAALSIQSADSHTPPLSLELMKMIGAEVKRGVVLR